MEGGTTFHFLDATPAEALHVAREAAGGRDVRIGGGPTVVRYFTRAQDLRACTQRSAPAPGRAAKGILMARFRVTPDRAFALLVRASQDSNRKLLDVAEELTTSGRLPGTD